MIINPHIKREPGESIDEYLLRLGSNKEVYNISWLDIKDLMNAEAEEDYSESKWRKDYHLLRRGFDLAIRKGITNDEVIKELEDKKLEFQKEKYRLQDQRRELNNIIRKQARFEHLKEEIHKAILEIEKIKPLVFESIYKEPTNVKANVLFSDWHYGQDFSNSLNTYNPEVFHKRVRTLINKIIYYGKKHNIDTLTVASLGDLISGIIHVSTRVQSSEDVIKQIQVVSEVLAQCLSELSKHFRVIRFINIIGNHGRAIPDKLESIFTENLENLIVWYLESRLRDFKNIQIYKDTDGYFVDQEFNWQHVYIHGDLDKLSKVANDLPQVLGIVPRYIFAGHIHHERVRDYGRTKVITNGSLMGVDSFALSNRFYAEPMQKMHIFNKKGDIEYSINITFDD